MSIPSAAAGLIGGAGEFLQGERTVCLANCCGVQIVWKLRMHSARDSRAVVGEPLLDRIQAVQIHTVMNDLKRLPLLLGQKTAASIELASVIGHLQDGVDQFLPLVLAQFATVAEHIAQLTAQTGQHNQIAMCFHGFLEEPHQIIGQSKGVQAEIECSGATTMRRKHISLPKEFLTKLTLVL